jgi:predicted N-formylglutamate amidohydrolase
MIVKMNPVDRAGACICLLLSCEHGGNHVPAAYRQLFAGATAVLQSHRGWDPGALQLARQFARTLGATLYAASTTRLLVDLNRSIGNRSLFSEFTRPLSATERRAIVARHYRPHRDRVEGALADLVAQGQRVIHIACHSFTPELHGVVRQADVAWLYDPRRSTEVSLARGWMAELAQRAPDLRLRRNYPYQGKGDGLTALLRKRFGNDIYAGIELEVNQRFALQGGAAWAQLRGSLTASLGAVLAGT